jgi:hypothetical protein
MGKALLAGLLAAGAALGGCAATSPSPRLNLSGTTRAELAKAKTLDELIAALRTPDDVATYAQVVFNYQSDSPIDYWNSARHTFENGNAGDCEDLATLAYVALARQGYDVQFLITARDANPKKPREKGPTGHTVAVYGKDGRYGIIGNADDEYTGLIFPSLEAAAKWHCELWSHTHYRYYDFRPHLELLMNGLSDNFRENIGPAIGKLGYSFDFKDFTPKPQ